MKFTGFAAVHLREVKFIFLSLWGVALSDREGSFHVCWEGSFLGVGCVSCLCCMQHFSMSFVLHAMCVQWWAGHDEDGCC